MKKIMRLTLPVLLLAFPALAEVAPDAYETIRIESAFSQMITRDEADRVYSGQIKTQVGLAHFEKAYGVTLAQQGVDFTKKMLIFGITDSITTRAFQFVKQETSRTFTLDYSDTGIEYRLLAPDKGKKHSYLQVFILDRIDGISHVRVKNLVVNGLSKVYDK